MKNNFIVNLYEAIKPHILEAMVEGRNVFFWVMFAPSFQYIFVEARKIRKDIFRDIKVRMKFKVLTKMFVYILQRNNLLSHDLCNFA